MFDIVKARYQRNYGGFACTCRSYQRNALPCLDIKGDMFQHVDTLFVAESNVLKADLTCYLAQFLCALFIGDGHRFVQRFKDTFEVSYVVDEVVHYV